MADSFTNDKIAALLQGTGDNENDWGERCNDETITPLAKAIAGYVAKSVAGNLDVTLTASEAQNAFIKLTGTLTGDIDVIVPAKVGGWLFWNATSGNFDLTVKTASGNGVVIPQGAKQRIWCDGTDALAAGATTQEASSAVNRLVVKSSATGTPVEIEAVGADPNIDIRLIPKGTGTLLVGGSGGIVPTGVILPFAGPTVPTGWLECYGQAVSRTTYAALFAVIGTLYGSGNGSTTFNLPDLRGRAVFGQDNMGGASAGRVTNTGTGNSGIEGDALGATGGDQRTQSHTHTFSGSTTTNGLHGHTLRVEVSDQVSAESDPTGGVLLRQDNAATYGPNTGSAGDTPGAQIGGSGSHSHTVSGTTGSSGNGGSQNMPPCIILKYIIKT